MMRAAWVPKKKLFVDSNWFSREVHSSIVTAIVVSFEQEILRKLVSNGTAFEAYSATGKKSTAIANLISWMKIKKLCRRLILQNRILWGLLLWFLCWFVWMVVPIFVCLAEVDGSVWKQRTYINTLILSCFLSTNVFLLTFGHREWCPDVIWFDW